MHNLSTTFYQEVETRKDGREKWRRMKKGVRGEKENDGRKGLRVNENKGRGKRRKWEK